jgi:hypothetical protein
MSPSISLFVTEFARPQADRGIDPEKALANGLWFSVPYHRASERSTFQLRHARRDAPHPILGE